MNIDEYQQHALKSIALPKGSASALSHRSLGLSGEAGELVNRVKKIIRDREGNADQQDVDFIKEKLGDVLYYAAALAEYYDIKLSDVAEANKQKSDEFRTSREK